MRISYIFFRLCDISENESFHDFIVEYDYPIHFELMPFMGARILDDTKNPANKT